MTYQCPYCHEPFRQIMVNHLVTSHVKDFCKVHLGVLGGFKNRQASLPYMQSEYWWERNSASSKCY